MTNGWRRPSDRGKSKRLFEAKKKGIKVTLRNYAKDSQLDKMKAKGFFPHFQYDGGAWAMAYLRYLTGTNKGVFTNYYKDIAELERTWRKEREDELRLADVF